MLIVPRRLLIGSILGTCLGVGFIIKDKFGGKKYTYKTDAAKNKLIIITGATSGIGKAAAKELAFRKARLVLACRDMEKCEKVRSHLIFSCKNKKIDCIECDLASQKSVKEFVKKFNEKYNKLDVLINNAGVMEYERRVTLEGIEMNLGVNHMGHFLLTNMLLPKLKDSAPSRVVNVVSIDYKSAHLRKEDLNYTKEYNAIEAYKQSKLGNVLFTQELSERLQGSGVTVNAVYPGIVNTNLLRNSSFSKSWLSSIFLKPILWLFIKNEKQGSQPLIYAAIEPDLTNVSGYLFGGDFVKQELHFTNEHDKNTAKWLWRVSEKWTSFS